MVGDPSEPAAREPIATDELKFLRAELPAARKRYRSERTRPRGTLGGFIGDTPYHAGNIAFLTISGLILTLLISIAGMIWLSVRRGVDAENLMT